MSRSFIQLRRVVFGASCAIVFGFGATQLAATPHGPLQARGSVCILSDAPYVLEDGCYGQCPENGGYCDGFTRNCQCW
jgi:hypothetical protein